MNGEQNNVFNIIELKISLEQNLKMLLKTSATTFCQLLHQSLSTVSRYVEI